MANNNSPRSTKGAAAKGAGSNGSSRRTAFSAILILIVVFGTGAIFYQMRSASAPSQTEMDEQYQKLKERYANAGPPQPYVIGRVDAPVVIEEFADFECPSCGRYATITEPDVRKRIIDAGLASYKYYDFPLPGHKNTQAASNAAACADEQGKFWELHDLLFAGQGEWGLSETGEGQITDEPAPIFTKYAQQAGLDVPRWQQCFTAKKYQSRVDANAGEAVRRNVSHTPTFYINGTMMTGSPTYDEIKKLVDAAAAKGPMSAADSALANMVKR